MITGQFTRERQSTTSEAGSHKSTTAGPTKCKLRAEGREHRRRRPPATSMSTELQEAEEQIDVHDLPNFRFEGAPPETH